MRLRVRARLRARVQHVDEELLPVAAVTAHLVGVRVRVKGER